MISANDDQRHCKTNPPSKERKSKKRQTDKEVVYGPAARFGGCLVEGINKASTRIFAPSFDFEPFLKGSKSMFGAKIRVKPCWSPPPGTHQTWRQDNFWGFPEIQEFDVAGQWPPSGQPDRVLEFQKFSE